MQCHALRNYIGLWLDDQEVKEQTPKSADTGPTRNQQAPFLFEYVERMLRRKNFGVLGTISHDGSPHSVGVVYAVGPRDAPFCLYLITRPVLKKARNIHSNPTVSFVVPFPHYIFRSLPPACIQFQGKAELISIDDPAAVKSFQSSLVLRRSMEHSLDLESLPLSV